MAGSSTSESKRALRSKSQVEDVENSKFNFDESEFEIEPTKKLRILTRKRFRSRKDSIQQYHDKDSSKDDPSKNLEEQKKLVKSMALTIEKHILRPKLVENGLKKRDSMSDDMYMQYHRKMLKQEARMLKDDAIESENEADRLIMILDKLDMIGWEMYLQKITVIKDPTDEEEMIRKRELTKNCISSMLKRYREIKKKLRVLSSKTDPKKFMINPKTNLSQIYDRVDRTFVLGYESSSDEEEEDMTISDIRQYRLSKREKQCGSSIIVTLTSKQPKDGIHGAAKAIVAEPLRKPYIIKLSKEERNKYKKEFSVDGKIVYRPSLPQNTATKVSRRKIPLTLSLDAEELEHRDYAGVYDITSSDTSTTERELSKSIVPSLGEEANDYSPSSNSSAVADNNRKMHFIDDGEIAVLPVRKKKKLSTTLV